MALRAGFLLQYAAMPSPAAWPKILPIDGRVSRRVSVNSSFKFLANALAENRLDIVALYHTTPCLIMTDESLEERRNVRSHSPPLCAPR